MGDEAVAALKAAIGRAMQDGEYDTLARLADELKALKAEPSVAEHSTTAVDSARPRFATAGSGRGVAASAAGLPAARGEEAVGDMHGSAAPAAARPMFSTGGGRSVKASAASLQHGQAAVRGEDTRTAPSPSNARPTFLTGGGRAMQASAASLQRGQAAMCESESGDCAAAAISPAAGGNLHLYSGSGSKPPTLATSVGSPGSSSKRPLFQTGGGKAKRPSVVGLHQSQAALRDAAAAGGAAAATTPSSMLHGAQPGNAPKVLLKPKAPAGRPLLLQQNRKPPAARPMLSPAMAQQPAAAGVSPAQHLKIAQNRAKAEELRRARRVLSEQDSGKAALVAEVERSRAMLVRRQQQLPTVGVWSTSYAKAAVILPEVAEPFQTPDKPQVSRKPRQALKHVEQVFNSHLPAAAVVHGRDEELLQQRGC